MQDCTLVIERRRRFGGVLLRTPDSSDVLLVLFSLLATVPVWVSIYPGMSDLPQHAAQVALLRNLIAGHFAYANEFRIHWFTPYLFGYLLIYVLTFFVSVVMACKVVVALFLAAVPLTTALLLRQANIDTFWAVLTIPGLYGFAFQWGFLNFLVAVPVGLAYLWFVRRQLKGARTTASISVVLFTLGLFFCHALVCAFCLLIVFIWIIVEIRPVGKAVRSLLAFFPAVAVAAIWAWLTRENHGVHRPIAWDMNWLVTTEPYYRRFVRPSNYLLHGWGRLNGFFARLIGSHSARIYSTVGPVLFALPAATPGFRKGLTRWAPLCICLGILFYGPSRLFGTDLVSPRFSILVLPLFLLTLKEGRLPQVKRLLSQSAVALLAIICIALASKRALVLNADGRDFQQLMGKMEPGERALSMVFDYDDGVSIAPVFLHLPSWYVSEKSGVVDPSVAMMFPELVVYRDGHVPKAVLWDFEWAPGKFNWTRHEGDRYRYFVLRSSLPVDRYLSSAPCSLSLRIHAGRWWLYERAGDCPEGRRITREMRGKE